VLVHAVEYLIADSLESDMLIARLQLICAVAAAACLHCSVGPVY